MKKVFAAGMLAICLIAVSHQQASAWTNTRFGIGLNWEHSSGGNCFGWGAWRNGQPPGPELMPSFQPNGTFPQGTFPRDGQAESTEPPTYAQPAYTPPSPTYGPPYQFANYPRQTYYYYPPPAYYYYTR